MCLMPPNKMLLIHYNTYGCDVTEQTSVGEGVICFKWLCLMTCFDWHAFLLQFLTYQSWCWLTCKNSDS